MSRHPRTADETAVEPVVRVPLERARTAEPAHETAGARLVRLQRQAGNRAVSHLVVQRRPLRAVGDTAEGSSLQDPGGGRWYRPGQAGYGQRLEGASDELAGEMVTGGELSGLQLRSVPPQLGGLGREQQFWLRQKAEAERHLEFTAFTPPSVKRSLEQRRDGAQAQLDAIARSRDELLVMTMNFNAFVPQGNTTVRSAAQLGAMQSLVGATDTAGLAAALETGLDRTLQAAQQYQAAYRGGSRAASGQLAVPQQDESAREAMDDLDDASRDLNAAYRDFRITEMEDLIRQLTEAGSGDRKRLAEIEKHKQMIRNVGATIDAAMSIVSPGGAANFFSPQTSIPDATRAKVVGAIPNAGSALSFVGDAVFEGEVRRIRQRLNALDSLMAAERAAIDHQRYQRRRDAFAGALATFHERVRQLQARLGARRTSYRGMGEQLDRLARSRGALGGASVGEGQEHFSTVLTVVAGVRELLGLARWNREYLREKNLTPTVIRTWYGQVTAQTRPQGDAAARWRVGGLTEGENQMVRSVFEQVAGHDSRAEALLRMFAAVDRRAGEVMGHASLHGRPHEGAY